MLHPDRELEQLLDARARHHANDRDRQAALSCRAHVARQRGAVSVDGSGYQNGKRLETPDLKISYKAPAKSWYAHGEGS